MYQPQHPPKSKVNEIKSEKFLFSLTFTLKGTQNKFTASLATLLTTTSYFTTRLSRDLFANFLATSIMLLALTMLIHANEKPTKRNTATTAIILVAPTLIHPWTTMITLATITTYIAITILKNDLKTKNKHKQLH